MTVFHLFIFCFPSRLRCPQYNLQCVSWAVPQLQQPVRWWLRHRVQTKTPDSHHLLFPGPFLLEKVTALIEQTMCRTPFFLKAVFWTWFNSKGCLLFLFLDKRCAVGLSIRVDLERWSLILDCSSPAAAPKSRRHWHPHKWPHAFPTRFLHSSQKTWKKPGDCFC